MTQREIAIFGGSFDPPHFGHVVLALYALSLGDVERVIVAPTFQHAFNKPLAPFEHRIAMCQLAFADLSRVEVSPIERELGGTSRTLRLITELEKRLSGHGLRLLVGADILHETFRWQGFDQIRVRAPLLVAGRASHPHPDLDPRTPSLPDVSSTAVRAALENGEDVSHWVPREVCRYLEQHPLYRGGA